MDWQLSGDLPTIVQAGASKGSLTLGDGQIS